MGNAVKAQFRFEDVVYVVPTDAAKHTGDVVKLPDGRFLEISWLESFPPQASEIHVVAGPTDVPSPDGRGEGHKGQVWDAKILEF